MDAFGWFKVGFVVAALVGLVCLALALAVGARDDDRPVEWSGGVVSAGQDEKPPGWFYVSIVAFIVAGLMGLVWGVYAIDGVGCKGKATQMGDSYHYSPSTGCVVQDNGRWIPIDQVFNNRQESG